MRRLVCRLSLPTALRSQVLVGCILACISAGAVGILAFSDRARMQDMRTPAHTPSVGSCEMTQLEKLTAV